MIGGPATSPPGSPVPLERVTALDGLRGFAACIVVAFHYLYLLYPATIPPHVAPNLAWLADTPFGILWNGRFAVSVFFVLSGFVIAGAADRRREWIVVSVIVRYLRLAVPVLMSVLLAWVMLTLLPSASLNLVQAVDDPSPWASGTHQGDIPSLRYAIADGLFYNFIHGGSQFNNVLWTMQIELIGSVGIFLLYAAARGWLRVVLLVLVGLAIVLSGWLPSAYLTFALGALLYEAHIRGWFRELPPVLPLFSLLAGLSLGAPGPGAAERLYLDGMPFLRGIGAQQSSATSFAAALILFSILALPSLQRPISGRISRWLGRISFSLYLVHVPLLYTVVAFAFVNFPIHPLLLATLYAAVTLALAHAFTVAVDERALTFLGRIRALFRPPARPIITSGQTS